MALPRILLIDDNQSRAPQVSNILQFLDYAVTPLTTAQGDFALHLRDDVIAIILGSGSDKLAAVIKNITEQASNLPLILLIDRGTALQVATPIQKMVSHLQEWPSTYPVFNEMLNKFKQLYQQNTPRANASVKGLAGKSAAIATTRALVEQVADSDATVLILGESGTGKEVIAQMLHRLSARRDRPFVPVNCGAIPGELLESELFGHEKGAFTGALTTRQGRFELAEGGTLFLDEIGDMPMSMQVKLLRVLQERTFERVGSNKTIECDVRIIAATHRHLDQEIKEQRFREDLFYRLNVFPIDVPALRDRAEDIPELVQDLVNRLQAGKKNTISFTPGALSVLMQHPWPGNVRELANLIERLTIIKPNSVIDIPDLPEKFQHYVPLGQAEDAATEADDFNQHEIAQLGTLALERMSINATGVPVIAQLPEQGIDLKEYLNDMEIDLIRQALTDCNGVVAHAAKRLNMRRTTLVEKLRKFELSR